MPDDVPEKAPARSSSADEDEIALSPYTDALLGSLTDLEARNPPDEYTKLTVSRAVSLLAIVYERIRNAVEYREDHLIRRAAIERILRRRLAINPEGKGEAENLLRELLWARYFPKNSLGEEDVADVQSVIDAYLSLRLAMLSNMDNSMHEYLSTFLIELMTCELEELLSPDTSSRESLYTYYLFQTLHQTVKIEEIPQERKDILFMTALERAYRKSDRPYQRYHLYLLQSEPLSKRTEKQRAATVSKLPDTFRSIDRILADPQVEKLTRFAKKQMPAYLILFEIITDAGEGARELLHNKTLLWNAVEKKCNEKYEQTRTRLTTLAVKSLVYIFVTKMLLAILLEYPVSMLLYGEAPLLPIVINSLFPPLLMLMIVLWFRLPDKDNTVKLFQRIVQIVNKDPSFETRVTLIARKTREKTRMLSGIFTLIYVLAFGVTFYSIHAGLSFLGFHLLSQIIFIFFVCIVSFFSYRIKQVVNEYRIIDKESALAPLTDFFFLPILSVGKIFNKGIAKINVFTVLFDFIIEAPFKLIIDVLEEWISFMRARKDEIV
jgi:hypothetical protein